VAHAQNSLGHAIRIKRFERVVTLANADKLHRLPGDLLDRKRRAATRITVHLCQNHSRDSHEPVKLFGGTNSVLASHSISDKEDLNWMSLPLDVDQLFHQLVVDVQTACGVDQQRVEAG